jgi:predicted Fe-Mo cluster-binding NifX family protein
MKIAVSVAGEDLDAQIDPRFGRCQTFLVVDLDTLDFEVVANTGSASGGGAGVAAGQLIAGKGVEAVLTGNCGPNAFSALDSAGIKVITGVSGAVRQAVEDYKAGKFQATSQPTVDAHAGMGRGQA